MKRLILLINIYIIVFSLLSCKSDKTETVDDGSVTTQSSPISEEDNRLKEDEIRYDSTIQQGIYFALKGFPSFVEKVEGLSVRDEWGRWTGSKNVKFYLNQALPKKFTLHIVGCGYESNANQPTKIRIGNTERTFTAVKCWDSKEYNMDFNLSSEERVIEVIPPNPTVVSGANADLPIGIALVRMYISPTE